MENYLDKLNPNQREAVTSTEGPLLVLAGAGSGKTTVLASRIAYIMQNTYTRAWNILAITFTNKAAQEMRDRIEKYVGNDVNSMWIGTFHSVCVKILRTCIDRVGYTNEFVIYDTADTRTLMKECVREFGLDEKAYAPRSVLSVISNAKNEMISVEDFKSDFTSNPRMREVARLYELYQRKLKTNNALDFDDIILLTVDILKNNEDIREKYQEKFKYILVDEYQDTNNAQYELISLLVNSDRNVCVVGDDDQSIYKFRGANVNNILEFEKDYKGAKKITLDENYRSTSIILEAANAVIANNSKRMGKSLWTSKDGGENIGAFTGFSEKDEAAFIAARARREHKEGRAFSDLAVLYRTNAQSRAIEEALMLEAVPYKVLAGQKFYDRKEIKDIIAYLKIIYNPDDSVSISRIINEPKRKIGAATLDKISKHMAEENTTMFDVINNVEQYGDLKSAAVRIKEFAAIINRLRKRANEVTVDVLVRDVTEETGYMAMLKNDDTVESRTRIENIEEFINVAYEFANNADSSGKLGEFIENVTLVSDIDAYDQEEDCVSLMTIHSAKGLEFPVVFMTGMEEDLFPSGRMGADADDIEEERRLCYVAITRAKEKLYVSRALSRFKFGQRIPCDESRFMREIPGEFVDDLSSVPMKAESKLERMGISIKPERKTIIHKPVENDTPAMGTYNFKPGDRVMHRKFGEGSVISSQAFGKDAIVDIMFDSVGQKRLMAAFAKLELVGEGGGE